MLAIRKWERIQNRGMGLQLRKNEKYSKTLRFKHFFFKQNVLYVLVRAFVQIRKIRNSIWKSQEPRILKQWGCFPIFERLFPFYLRVRKCDREKKKWKNESRKIFKYWDEKWINNCKRLENFEPLKLLLPIVAIYKYLCTCDYRTSKP